jgi:cytochrome c-type biogenesis protein CcmH/NrfG
MGDEDPLEIWTPEEQERLRRESRLAAERSRRVYNKWHYLAGVCLAVCVGALVYAVKTGELQTIVLTFPFGLAAALLVNIARVERGVGPFVP